MARLIVIRHCKATGQEADAWLTETGIEEAQQLATFLESFSIQRIITSPFTRAIETITPYAIKHGLQVEVDDRLQERTLSTENMEDWLDKLEQTYIDLDLKFAGGESSNEAMKRVNEVVNELIKEEGDIVLVTHGNLMSLLLHHISPTFGFREWAQLSNPDVYIVEQLNGQQLHFKRIWK